MPLKLITTVSKIELVPNRTKANLLHEFYQCTKFNGSSEHNQNNNLKVILSWAKLIGANTTFYDIQCKEQVITFLNTKSKTYDEDTEKRPGGGPILLTSSFPYVLDWLNKHPFKNSPDSSLICNLNTGEIINV